MDLKAKTEIYDSSIKEHPCFRMNNYDYIAGYFTNVDMIVDNDDFLDVYRHVQFFGLPITNDMKRFASIPNYAPQSLIANMALTSKDTYFDLMKEIIENPKNVYTPNHFIEPSLNGNIYHQLVENDRADLTQHYYDENYPPDDIYSNTTSANTTLEVIRVLMLNDYVPSDDIICWYLMKGMGRIAKQCITKYSDLSFITDCHPTDLDSFNFINDNRIEPYDMSDLIILLYNIVSVNNPTDVALFCILYDLVRSDITLTEKFDILKRVLAKNESFLIYTYMRILKEDGFTNSQLENQVFYVSKNQKGFIIFKIQIEKCKDLDIVADMCLDLNSDEKLSFYNEDENGFISAQNEKYANSSDSESDNYETSDDERDDNSYPDEDPLYSATCW